MLLLKLAYRSGLWSYPYLSVIYTPGRQTCTRVCALVFVLVSDQFTRDVKPHNKRCLSLCIACNFRFGIVGIVAARADQHRA